MKPRIEKKLSKKLSKILRNVRGFTPKDVWIDKYYSSESFQIHWDCDSQEGLSSKQKRQNWQRMRSNVDNMPSIGGDLDYWGEGTDYSSVFDCAVEMLSWKMFPVEPYDTENNTGGWPAVNINLTGKAIINLAYRYASGDIILLKEANK